MKFAIITCSYNSAPYVGDCITSVAQQRPHASVQHIIKDACSSDDTHEAVLRNASPELIWVSKADGGLSDGFNQAVELIDPDVQIIGWLNSDEYLAPETLDIVADFMVSNPSVDVVYGDTVRVDEAGKIIRLLAQHKMSRVVLEGYGPFIQTGSMYFRRSVLDSGQLRLRPDLSQSMDYELFLRLAREGFSFAHIPKVLSFFRVHSNQLTAVNGSEVSQAEQERVRKLHGLHPRPRLALAAHRFLKLANGAYVRERSFANRTGRSTLWMTR